METRYFKVDPRSFQPEELAEPAAILRQGGLVAFPTETVYGLGASAYDAEAVERLRAVKERPPEKHFTLLLADRDEVALHVEEIPRTARLLMERYWPGPLTIILPRAGQGTGRGTGGESEGEGIGLRVPASDIARELIRQAKVPVAAPSANPSGKDPATDAAQARAYFDGSIDAIVDGGPSVIKQSSTVVQVDRGGYRVIREGMITHEMIHQLLVGRNILFVCSGNSCRSPMAAALFRKLLAQKLGYDPEDLGELRYSIRSAGTSAFGGGGASPHAVEVMAAMGCDISGHVTRPVSAAMIEEADRIYTMSSAHVRQLVQWSPGAAGKIQLLREGGISDPIGGDLEGYRECARQIEEALQAILKGF